MERMEATTTTPGREVRSADLTMITDFDWKPGDILIDSRGRNLVTKVEHLPIGSMPWTRPL